MLRPLLTSLLIYSIALTAAAQQTNTTIELLKPSNSGTISDWPIANASLPHEIKVITLARPGVRHKCQVRDLTADALICESSHHRPAATYQRDEIAALIGPPSHSERNIMLIPIALMAAALVGSFFDPLAWSITLRIFAGLFFDAFCAMGFGATGSDHGPMLLQQRPNTPVTVTLPTH